MELSTSYANSEMMLQGCSSQLSQTRECQFGQARTYRECYLGQNLGVVEQEGSYEKSYGTLEGPSKNSSLLSAVRIQEYLLEPMYSWMKPKKGDQNQFGRSIVVYSCLNIRFTSLVFTCLTMLIYFKKRDERTFMKIHFFYNRLMHNVYCCYYHYCRDPVSVF
jgi:hypothetical protein